MPESELSRVDAQNLLDKHIETIRSICWGEDGVKWPRFRFGEDDRLKYYLDLLLTLPSDFENAVNSLYAGYLKRSTVPSDCGVFFVTPAALDGSRRLAVVRSVRDQSARLFAQVLLTPEENALIERYCLHPSLDNRILVQKMLLIKTVGFWDHSILRLKTPEDNIRYSLKAGKGNRVGAGSFAVVKDELACAVFNPGGERVNLLSEPQRVIRAAVEVSVDPFVQELNLYDAAASGRAPKKTKNADDEKHTGKVKHKPRNTEYTVQSKSISLHDWIKLNNPFLAVPTPFAFSALPAGTPEEVKQLFLSAISLTQAVRLLHKKGIAHRDLKPKNILLEVKRMVTNEERYQLKLADFGLSIDCRGLIGGLDAIPKKHAGTFFYMHDFMVAPGLTYRQIDTIALLKTLFIDENSVFFLERLKKFIAISDPRLSDDYRKKLLLNSHYCCHFPRALVDRSPALSIILRSASRGVSVPYDIDTVLCALLLESHGLLDSFRLGGELISLPN